MKRNVLRHIQNMRSSIKREGPVFGSAAVVHHAVDLTEEVEWWNLKGFSYFEFGIDIWGVHCRM